MGLTNVIQLCVAGVYVTHLRAAVASSMEKRPVVEVVWSTNQWDTHKQTPLPPLCLLPCPTGEWLGPYLLPGRQIDDGYLPGEVAG